MTKPNICPNCRAFQARAAEAEADAQAWYDLYAAFVKVTAQYHFAPELPPFIDAYLERFADTRALFEGWPR